MPGVRFSKARSRCYPKGYCLNWMTPSSLGDVVLPFSLLDGANLTASHSNHSNEKEAGKAYENEGGHPGNDVEDRAIRMSHHQLLIIDQQKDKDENNRQDHSIDHL